jgi:hypothetical protein
MVDTYDLNTDVGKIRSLIPDRDITDPVFSDAEITYYFSSSGNIRYAAATALEIAATQDVLIFKVMKSGTDSVDAAKGAAVLLDRARRLRQEEDDLLVTAGGVLGVIEMGNGVFGYRQVVRNAIRRAT